MPRPLPKQAWQSIPYIPPPQVTQHAPASSDAYSSRLHASRYRPVLSRKSSASWKNSSQVWDCMTTHASAGSSPPRPAEQPALPAREGLINAMPSANRTWDWDWVPSRARCQSLQTGPNFRGGSVVVSSAAPSDNPAEQPTQRRLIDHQTNGNRDPILQGDDLVFRTSRKHIVPPPTAARLTGDADVDDYRTLRGRRLPYDPTLAGRRTDIEPDYRPSIRRTVQPASFSIGVDDDDNVAAGRAPVLDDRFARRGPRSHLCRSRDIITQTDAEFATASKPMTGIRTYPGMKHVQSGEANDLAYKPAIRPLASSDVETSRRIMHYNLPLEGQRPAKAGITTDKNAGIASDVINYRFSGGICPDDRRLVDTRPDRFVQERQLQRTHRDEVNKTREKYLSNRRRSTGSTQIY